MFDFFEFSNEMLCLADDRGYFIRVNPAWTETLGWSAAELTSHPFLDFVHPDDHAATIREAGLLHGGRHETVSFENRYRCHDGSYRWLAWRARLEPTTRQLVAAARDVTEQRLQAQALRESEQRFRMLADHAPIGIVQCDPEGNMFYVNDKWCELADVPRTEATGRAWEKVIHPDDLSRLISHWKSFFQTGQNMPPVEFRFVHKNSAIRWISSSNALLRDASGKIVSQIGTLVDITEIQRGKQALLEEQDLLRNLIEVQEQEKQFLCQEFHDGLIQYAFGSMLLLESCRHAANDPANSGKIETAIGSLGRGIEDGRRVIRGVRPAVLDDSGLQAAMEDLIGQFESSGLHITCKCDPTIGRLSESIQTTVYRVVQEALNNARKYSGTDVVRIELSRTDHELHFEIRDFGCGFDVESARKNGFGLRGMTERVRLLGGECLISSDPESGTCISARLPIPDRLDQGFP